MVLCCRNSKTATDTNYRTAVAVDFTLSIRSKPRDQAVDAEAKFVGTLRILMELTLKIIIKYKLNF